MFIAIFPFDILEQFYLIIRLVTVISFITLLGIFVVAGDLITVLIAVELFLLTVMVGAIVVAGFSGDPAGELFVLTVLVIGAAETAVALSIVTLFYQGGSMTGVDLVTTLEEIEGQIDKKAGGNGRSGG